jgi:hypothetical protein
VALSSSLSYTDSLTYSAEGLDSLIGHLGFCLGIVDQEEVDHLFDLEDGDGHAGDDVWVKGGHVVAHGHVGDDFFEGLLFAGIVPVLLVRVELQTQLLDLACSFVAWIVMVSELV